MALSTAVTGFVLAVPVVSSGSGTSPMSLDSSSSSAAPGYADETSPVVMGRDGAARPVVAARTAPVVPPAPEVAPTPRRVRRSPATAEAPAAARRAATSRRAGHH